MPDTMAPSALTALRRLQKASQKKEEERPAPVVPKALPGFLDVEDMALDAFAQAGLVVRVRSRLLGEDILLVSDNVQGVNEEGELVVYRVREARRLLALAPEDLQEVHRVKRAFPGSRVTEMNLEAS